MSFFDSERFVCDERTGEEISSISTEELASDIRYDYAHGNGMNENLARDLCWRAGLTSALAAIRQILEDADEDTLSLFEDVDEIAPLCEKLLELRKSEK